MSAGDIRVRLLGPVDVAVGDAIRTVSGLRRKTVLAVIGLHPGEAVSTDRLIDLVWGEDPPTTAANTLQSHVSYLRGILGGRGTIAARSPGYVLDLPAEATDVQRAEALIRQVSAAGDHAATVARLRSALELWRGQSLSDVSGVVWLHEQAARLDRLRLDAIQALVDARLALGEHIELVPELEQLAGQHPFREQIHGQLMLALYRSGRQADALDAFQRLRRTIGLELGLDPSPKLRDLEAAILRQDLALNTPEPSITLSPALPAATIPAQLPLAVPTFTGRSAEVSVLNRIMDATGTASDRCTVTVATVSGTAGVGKTALVVRWAHQVAHHFPDGQLYVNLRGFDAGGAVMEPADVVRRFLDSLGVPGDRIPSALDAQASLYRSVLAGKRVLIVLDNALDDEQVRPLLPGAPGCVVVVTSRNQLTGLTAAEGAHPINLDLPPIEDARRMLIRRLGERRVAAEPAAVNDIIARCAQLPLALAVAAARAAAHPDLPLAALATQLHDAACTLDPFGGSDPATDIRAVFSWSYNTLGADAARLFRCLGLTTGQDISLAAVASLVGLPEHDVEMLVAELTHAHLLVEANPRRYTVHDLLRAYAVEQMERHETDDERIAALQRILDHYLHTAYAAAMLLSPAREPIVLATASPGVTTTPLTDLNSAMEWFTAELAALRCAVGHARASTDWRGWQVAWTLSTFLDRRGCWDDNIAIQREGLASAIRAQDTPGQAYAHRLLANTHVKLNRFAEADHHNRQALQLAQETGDNIGEANAHLGLAWLAEQQDDFGKALGHAHRALRSFTLVGNRRGRAHVLNTMGWCHAQMGTLDTALGYCEQALMLLVDVGDQGGEAGTWDSLGFLHLRRGEHSQALNCYRRAVTIYHAIGDQYNEADAIVNLGDVHAAMKDTATARRTWQKAAAMLDRLEHPDAEAVHAKVGSTERIRSTRLYVA